MIRLEKISKKYDKHYAIKDINLNFIENETIAIIGSSGSGKSTLLICNKNLE